MLQASQKDISAVPPNDSPLEIDSSLQRIHDEIEQLSSRKALEKTKVIISEKDVLIKNLNEKLCKYADERDEYIAINAGLRAVMQSLINLLKLHNSNSFICKRENRERRFVEAEKAEIENINRARIGAAQPFVVFRLDPKLRKELNIF